MLLRPHRLALAFSYPKLPRWFCNSDYRTQLLCRWHFVGQILPRDVADLDLAPHTCQRKESQLGASDHKIDLLSKHIDDRPTVKQWLRNSNESQGRQKADPRVFRRIVEVLFS